MPAYLLFIREGEIFDPEMMAKYKAHNRSGNSHIPVKPLVAYGAMETLEGEAADGVVILEFPTMDDARAWYNAPDYQEASQFRKAAANYRAILIEGFDPAKMG